MNYYLVYILILLLVILVYIRKKTIDKSIDNFDNKKDIGFVINLDKRTDRWKSVQDNFKDCPIFLQRFSAIKHKRGWIGCGLSHMKLVEMAKENKMPYLLIIEDDCKPTKFMKHWVDIKKWLHNNNDKWDIFLGGNCYYNFMSLLENASDSITELCKLNPQIDLFYTKLMCTQFTYINSSVYDKYLEWEKQKDGPIDSWPDKNKMRVVSCVPFIAIQGTDHSDIRGYTMNYNKIFSTSEKRMKIKTNTKSCI